MNLLIVDDDAVMRATLRDILEREDGWRVIDADDGESAWGLLNSGFKPDLCVFDIVMPRLDGIALLEQMRGDDRFKQTKVIYVTLAAERRLVKRAMQYNIAGYILKPFSASRVLATIRDVAKSMPQRVNGGEQAVLEDPETVISRLEIDYPRYLHMLQLFIHDLRDGVKAIEKMLEEAEVFPAMSRLDGMKGSCLTFGARKFQRVADTVLQDLQNPNTSLLYEAMDELQTAHDNIKSEIEEKGLTTELDDTPGGRGKRAKERPVVLLVEDKPLIVKQFKEQLRSNHYKIAAVNSSQEAMDLSEQVDADLFIVSLSLENRSAFGLLRFLRSSKGTRDIPVWALSLKTAVDEHREAEEVGFNAIVTKPVDFGGLKERLVRTLHLETANRALVEEGEMVVITLPAVDNTSALKSLVAESPEAVETAAEKGLTKVLVDLSAANSFSLESADYLSSLRRQAASLGLECVFVGPAELMEEKSTFEELAELEIIPDRAQAFGGSAKPETTTKAPEENQTEAA